MASRLCPLSQAPTEFNSKVQRTLASFPDERPSAGEMSWLIKMRGGPGQQAHRHSLPTAPAVKALNPLPPRSARCPQEKPINLTLLGFSIAAILGVLGRWWGARVT